MTARVPGRLGRLAALLGLASGALHLALVGSAPTLHALTMLALAAVCLSCSVGLWRGATRRTWATVAGVNAAMLLVHLAAPSGGHGHGGHGAHGDATAAPLALAGALAGVEVILALAVLAAGALATRAHAVEAAQ